MKIVKTVGYILLGIILVVILVVLIGRQKLKPEYDGAASLPGLQREVNVFYDPYGIPHIYAKSELDAIRALGYVHAQDRLWQMELLRRVGSGGLSEVFGEELLDADKLFLSLGIADATEKTVRNLDSNDPVVRLSQAYLDGINSFISDGPTPMEFLLTGIDKTPFTLNDIYNSMGYMAYTFATAHRTDPLLTAIKTKLDSTYLVDLEIDGGAHPTRIPNHKDSLAIQVGEKIALVVNSSLSGLPIPQFMGSNSWVIGPEKTKNGKVILANDPHIGFAQPSTWYEAHLNAPGYEKYGYHLAGFPFPLLAHNRKAAYGLTMFLNDDTDFYFEEVHPKDSMKYKTADGWADYSTRTYKIPVKDADTVVYTYKVSEHGPLVNGISKDLENIPAVSMSWLYTQLDNKLLQVLHGISHAEDIESFRNALPDLHAPGLNVMYGDAEGNIAWWATAKLYDLPEGVNSKFILNGANGQEEPVQYRDFNENPQSVNPPVNYVYSANNQPDSIMGGLYRGYYLPENRARRIVNLLDGRSDWDLESSKKMITDVTSPINPMVATNLAKSIAVKSLTDQELKILDILGKWEGDYPLNSVAATVYHRWIYFFLENTFADEIGDTLFPKFLDTNFCKRLIAPMATKEESVWWDDVSTAEKESKRDIVRKSFDEAISSLKGQLGEDHTQWTWERTHTLEHEHPMGKVEALRTFFNVGPYPVPGSREVINNLAFPYDGDGLYQVTAGPSTRRIIDFSDIENSVSILPTGQSGNPLSPHYEDQAEMFVKGEFRKMLLNKKEIEETSVSRLLLRKE
ncbi:penicillin acylase family protein [Zeaxanthinibacter sp. PT1]|uniref:penicillin acylase family protein n=1 Tax=Zeaxanthinibacter TaxID=561554 RepID=UPI00234AD643|nr:penicillin acylase family protein [Zeaxanthinibacter sp. PT1]MDC6351395.1 penicillin acylase family protein [Zeaxanthinibacter sp. PT1]